MALFLYPLEESLGVVEVVVALLCSCRAAGTIILYELLYYMN